MATIRKTGLYLRDSLAPTRACSLFDLRNIKRSRITNCKMEQSSMKKLTPEELESEYYALREAYMDDSALRGHIRALEAEIARKDAALKRVKHSHNAHIIDAAMRAGEER